MTARKPFPKGAKRALLATIAVFGLAIVAVNMGLLDRLSMTSRVHRGLASFSLTLYGVLVSLVILTWGAWRRAPKKTALALGSIAFCIVAFDVLARVTNIPFGKLQFKGVASARFHHAYPPHTEMSMRLGLGGWTTCRTNEDGLRTAYSRKDFQSHRRRVAVLGDSFAFGLGVREEEAFPARLEQELRRTGSDVAVLNAATISYSPFVERLLFESTVRDYRPDTVALLLDATDFADDIRYSRAAKTEGGKVVFATDGPTEMHYWGPTVEMLDTLVGEPLSYPFRVLSRRAKKFNYSEFRVEIGDEVSTNTYFHFQYPLERTRPFLEATLASIDAIAAASEAIGARFVLLVSPRFQHWNPQECPRYDCPYDRAEKHQLEMFRFFAEAQAGRSYPIISLLEPMREAASQPLAFEDDPHWNPHGHAVVAGIVARLLEERGFLN